MDRLSSFELNLSNLTGLRRKTISGAETPILPLKKRPVALLCWKGRGRREKEEETVSEWKYALSNFQTVVYFASHSEHNLTYNNRAEYILVTIDDYLTSLLLIYETSCCSLRQVSVSIFCV